MAILLSEIKTNMLLVIKGPNISSSPPVPTIININMIAPVDATADPSQAKKITRFAEDAIVKLETISPRIDYSIENVNLTMTLKDETTGDMNEVSGRWEHQN